MAKLLILFTILLGFALTSCGPTNEFCENNYNHFNGFCYTLAGYEPASTQTIIQEPPLPEPATPVIVEPPVVEPPPPPRCYYQVCKDKKTKRKKKHDHECQLVLGACPP